MIIVCPQCRTKYRLADEKVKPEGSRVRCSRCGYEFSAGPEDDVSESMRPQGQALAGEQADEDRHPGDDRPEPGTRPGGRPRANRGRLVVLVLIFFILAGVGTYLYWPQIRARLPFLPPQAGQKIELSQKKSETADSVASIALRDVRQYMVDNEKLGRVLVIEGSAVNTSKAPYKMIKIQASLFDDQGKSLSTKTFLCGNTASLYQLQVLSKDDLQGVLSSKAGVVANNSHLGPDQEVPFMTVFPEFPGHVAEFSLKVIQALKVPDPGGQSATNAS